MSDLREPDGLRGLLHDAVDDVHPGAGPEEVRERAGHPSPSRWLPITVAAAIAMIVVLAGTAYLTGGSEPRVSGPTSPTAAPQPEDVARDVVTSVYYWGQAADGPRLFAERHLVPDATGSELQVAVDQAVRANPIDTDYVGKPLGSGVTVRATQSDGEIVLDLRGYSDSGLDLSGEEQQVALQALVWTADTAVGTDAPVRFLVDGKKAAVVLSTSTDKPVSKASPDSVLSPVSIEGPREGETVRTTFDVRGSAAAAEGTVVWELVSRGKVVQHGFATAEQCCTLSPYSFEVTTRPGTYTLVVHDTDESSGEGVGVTQDTKHIVVNQGRF